MRLQPRCPQCGTPLAAGPGPGDGTGNATSERSCPVHGTVQPCWRAAEVSYDAFAEHLVLSRGLPTWLPWPLPPGWRVADFGCVGGEGRAPQASFTTCVGPTAEDGGVALTVVTEEPGTGLGAHLAGVLHSDPGRSSWDQPVALRLRVDGASVPLWPVATTPVEEDRSVLAGEAQGRWLWMVITPAEAVLGLVDRASLSDASALGPELLSVTFGSGPGLQLPED